MRSFTRLLLIVAPLLVPAPSLLAQTAVDPSGHWEGSIQIPDREATFEIDLTRNARGELSGTMRSSTGNIKSFPLREVVVAGRSVSFDARRDQPFKGAVSADGKSISGDATLSGYVLPFNLTRTGDARITAPETSAPIRKELEGTWNGAIAANGTSMRFDLMLANHPDGSATARLISLDEGELEIPASITQKAAGIVLDVKAVGGSYSGALNADGTELTGTYRQGGLTLPLVFKRATTEGKR